jgi:hypothetical protein
VGESIAVTKNMTVAPADKDDWVYDYDLTEALYDCHDKGSKLLCELAKIPDACADQFRNEVGRVLCSTYLGNSINIRWSKTDSPEIVAAIEKFERTIREAYSIFLSLPEDWRNLFFFFEVRPGESLRDANSIVSALRREEPWDSIFRRMIRKCAEYTGKRPIVIAKRGRGRRRGDSTKDTYPLKNFVWKLARAVRRHGGGLTLYAKEQSGTWIDALNGLRPLFPEGFIPNVLSLSMIEEVQTKANKLPL